METEQYISIYETSYQNDEDQSKAQTYIDNILENGHDPEDFRVNYEKFLNSLNSLQDPDYETKYSQTDKGNLTRIRTKFNKEYGVPPYFFSVGNFIHYVKYKQYKADESAINKDMLYYENQIKDIQKKVKGQKAIKENSQLQNLLTFSNKTNPVIDALNKFNNKINQLYIFFKGKI